ncbi:hypothetical protein PENSPDRAFT_667600 [Peniophora sp. CONT]|nr:hypothetical protein PENSPDRAFT_667600 [Peniophora sp. CONT]
MSWQRCGGEEERIAMARGLAKSRGSYFPGSTACVSNEDAATPLLLQILQNPNMTLNIFAAILRYYRRRKDRKASGNTVVTTGPPPNPSVVDSASAPDGTTYETWYVPDEALRDLSSTFPLPEVPFAALHLSAIRRHLNNEGRHLAALIQRTWHGEEEKRCYKLCDEDCG